MTRLIPRLFLLALWLGFCAPANSHHSIVEFDYTQAYAVTGTIKELQWTNPHSWVQMLVENSAGESIEFGFELGAPVFNIRMGWRKDSVKPGDEVTVVFCPAKSGAPRGTLMYIYLPSGERLSGIAPRIYSGKAFDAPSEVPASPILAGAE